MTIHSTARRRTPAKVSGRVPIGLPLVGVLAGAVALAGCSAIGAQGQDEPGTVVLVTHDSFALPEELIAQFEADTGLTLVQRAPGVAWPRSGRGAASGQTRWLTGLP